MEFEKVQRAMYAACILIPILLGMIAWALAEIWSEMKIQHRERLEFERVTRRLAEAAGQAGGGK